MSDLNFLIEFGGKREKIVQFTAVWDDKYWVSIYSAILGQDFYFYFEAIPSFTTNDDKYIFGFKYIPAMFGGCKHNILKCFFVFLVFCQLCVAKDSGNINVWSNWEKRVKIVQLQVMHHIAGTISNWKGKGGKKIVQFPTSEAMLSVNLLSYSVT